MTNQNETLPLNPDGTFNKSDYRPLPRCVTITSSQIDGLGLMTTEKLGADRLIGITHIWEASRQEWIRTPLGGFINHSDDPNCFIHTHLPAGLQWQRDLYTIKPIQSGEELSVYYTL